MAPKLYVYIDIMYNMYHKAALYHCQLEKSPTRILNNSVGAGEYVNCMQEILFLAEKIKV